MHREYQRWYSPSLGREMELLIFGHAGARVLVFPSSMGRFFEWEDRGMIGVLEEHLEQGWLQLYCVDSIDAESWYARWAHPSSRAKRHAQYENYLLHEVLPLTTYRNPNPFLMTTGTSFGAYHAVNFAFRQPHLVGRVIGMSGIYDISDWTDGHRNDTIYFNNPCAYIPNEHDESRLEALRQMDIILTIGRDDPLCLNNQHLSGYLWDKGIWHSLRIWDGWAHDWPWWQQMIHLYIGGHD
ncbi:MAG TPA: alpha/beta hydrolase-fold protein [Anaerolineae bacterium]|nr:alpha/beta hydrolase-fold protein [Anaerolineae bacterium]